MQAIIQVLQKEVERLRDCIAVEQHEKERLLALLQDTEDKRLLAEAVASKQQGDRRCQTLPFLI